MNGLYLSYKYYNHSIFNGVESSGLAFNADSLQQHMIRILDLPPFQPSLALLRGLSNPFSQRTRVRIITIFTGHEFFCVFLVCRVASVARVKVEIDINYGSVFFTSSSNSEHD